MDSADVDRLYELFHPFVRKRVDRIKKSGMRLAHYTNADAATSILKNQEIWMRRVDCMNDYSEVLHGMDCLWSAFNNSPSGNNFWNVFEPVFDGLKVEVSNLFEAWLPYFKTETYISCFSEHPKKDDLFGRLSMWREYSGRQGVALVFNVDVFHETGNSIGLAASPVEYLGEAAFLRSFKRLVSNLEANKEFIQRQPRETLKAYIFNMAKYAALATKHPGFGEETEWRIIYCPFLEKEQHLEKSIESIGGIPQTIYKIPLLDIPEFGMAGMTVPALLDRLIIGPSDFSWPMREAFIRLLADVGVPDPENRVSISNIPLR